VDPTKHRDKLIGTCDDPPLDDHYPFGGHDPNLARLRVEIDGTILQAGCSFAPVSAFVLVER